MAGKGTALNFLIHDVNGQPQMIKVLQSAPATSKQAPVPVQVTSGPPKSVFKVPGTPEGSQQAPIYRTVKVTSIKSGQKLVQVPIQTLANLQKTATESQGQSPSGCPRKVQQNASGVRLFQCPPGQIVSSPSHSKGFMSPVLSGKRRETDHEPAPEYSTKRRKNADRVGKGLRHFSMKVCEKVRTKGFTSYNEVADELVEEFAAGMHGTAESQKYDQKNIRRRVYDALNVLMAMNIISKEKKEIRWLGLPTNSVQEFDTLERDKALKLERIQQKTQQLHDLILQQISFKSLVDRNKAAEEHGLKPSPSSAIHMPFIVVNTSDKALIDCSISNDKKEYMFNFNKKFQILDDMEILRRMGLLLGLDKGECTEQNMRKAKSMVPRSLAYYLEQLGRGSRVKMSDLIEEHSDEDQDEDDLMEEVEEEEEVDAPGADGEAEGEYSEESSSDIDIN